MKIVLIGSGNVATHLGPALIKAGHDLIQIVGRTETNTALLARKLNCAYTIAPSKISDKAEIYIIAIRDQAIEKYAKFIPSKAKLVLHTSGTVSMNALAASGIPFGVLYPIQSFSIRRKIGFSKVPLCLEANGPHAHKRLTKLATSLSNNVHWISHEHRKIIHLAAVFANNFSNHLFVLAEELLKKKGMSFDLLRPLIDETASKVQKYSPSEMQTGPAKRGDSQTIEKHFALLKNKPHISKVYDILTKSIQDHDGPLL